MTCSIDKILFEIFEDQPFVGNLYQAEETDCGDYGYCPDSIGYRVYMQGGCIFDVYKKRFCEDDENPKDYDEYQGFGCFYYEFEDLCPCFDGFNPITKHEVFKVLIDHATNNPEITSLKQLKDFNMQKERFKGE